MKRGIFIFLISTILTITYSEAQISNTMSVLTLLNEGESRYKELVDKANKTIARFEIDLVNQSSGKFTSVKLISGITYSILLIGELNTVSEIEMKINTYSNRSRVLISNVENSSRTLETTFKPDKSDFFEFEIIVKKFAGENKAGRYCLIVAN